MTTLPIADILNHLRAGKMIALQDDAARENEADLVIAAEYITEEQMAFLIRYTSGIICVPMSRERLAHLQLPRLSSSHPARFDTPYTMPVDAIHDTHSGVSAHDRTVTVRALVNPLTQPTDFGMPGHVFPLQEAEGGLKMRRGHTESSIALMRAAGLYDAAVIGELMNDDGTLMRGEGLMAFLEKQSIPLCSIEELTHYLNIHS